MLEAEVTSALEREGMQERIFGQHLGTGNGKEASLLQPPEQSGWHFWTFCAQCQIHYEQYPVFSFSLGAGRFHTGVASMEGCAIYIEEEPPVHEVTQADPLTTWHHT